MPADGSVTPSVVNNSAWGHTPVNQALIYAFDTETIANFKRLIKGYPENVIRQSFFAFDFSFHKYKGYIVLKFDDYKQMELVLKKFNLLPRKKLYRKMQLIY